MEVTGHRPFAIAARTMGMIDRPFTRVLLVNLYGGENVTAAYVNALWDTGATTSVMTARLARRMGFEFGAEVPCSGIGTAEKKALVGYAYVSLASNGDTVETLTAIVEDDLGDDYSFIIGMDLIKKGSLSLTCTKVETVLSFTIPAAPAIDYTRLLKGIDTCEMPLGITETENYKHKVYRGLEALRLIAPGIEKNLEQK